jgi:serine/threonine-protein kinase HipA
MTKTLEVYLNSKLTGLLTQTSEYEMTFAYSQDASRPISISMPVEKKTFGAEHCEAFFGGLLPEGDAARKALARRFGTSASNSFSLLSNIGADCAGALSLLMPGQMIASDEQGEAELLSEAALAQHIRELPQRPLFVGVNGMRLSLAGVQDKASVSVIDGAIGLPRGGPTTHILKPDLNQAPGVIYCENLCMKIASRLGISAASVDLAKAEDQVYLLVERYDRIKIPAGKNIVKKIERVHQEDFCQALAIRSSRKYQEDGGPKLVNCFALVDQTVAPAKGRLDLLTAIIFNFLVGNLDAHGKNFSLLHSSTGVRFAPLYDVICTSAFPEYSARMAMDIGDYFEPENIHIHEWRTLCGDVGYSYPALRRVAKRLCDATPAACLKEYELMQMAGWGHSACERALEIIPANCQQLKERLKL